jgi:hypothetical protein
MMASRTNLRAILGLQYLTDLGSSCEVETSDAGKDDPAGTPIWANNLGRNPALII